MFKKINSNNYNSSIYRLKLFIKLFILRDSKSYYINKWYWDRSEETKRYNYKLSVSSIVFDLGGYMGEWSEKIYKKYNCNLFIFEPVKDFYTAIVNKFNSGKVHIYNFGLGAKTEEILMKIDGVSSSVFGRDSNAKVIVKICDIIEFIESEKIDYINLMKINIEGAEYDLLDRLIDSNSITRIENLQIQFHIFVENAKQRRELLREKLKKTHYLTYDYPFVWENWLLINKGK